MTPGRQQSLVRRAGTMAAALAIAVIMATPGPAAGAPTPPAPSPTRAASPLPLFAFYYAWFDPSSWDRAKIDYPQLGRYSSDDPQVVRQHIAWARSAGIDGFIVSWKDTPVNDRRLRLLMAVAGQMDFKLALIYQGLDFDRNPLPVSQVAADFATFTAQYAGDPTFFRMGGKPLTIWSGTWAYTHAQVQQVTAAVRDKVLVLNTEKSIEGYARISDVTDGDAYYWSSVNPDTNTGYAAKLDAMGQAIHRDGKYWIAPFAPGFDARLVGGNSTVDRDDGRTLRTEYAAALYSSPDVLGLISWNEFSENSYVEPSQRFGTQYLDIVRELRMTPVPQSTSGADSSSDPVSTVGTARANATGARYGQAMLLGGFPVLLVVLVTLLGRRRRRHDKRVHIRQIPHLEER